ncbi:MAG: ATP-binding protein, partial [Candidatus Marinimicrobia bacterium]|nr:ATP-binding protein [Candidatus Neomarinimicrobiota bacterium]
YCFFDEIQVLKGWEAFIDRMMRNEKCEVYISGSSAQMLSQEIATQMRGRALSWEIFPFTFAEYLDYAGTEIRSNLSAAKRLKVIAKFEEYWQKGGFPEVAGLDSRLRIKIHQEYLTTILFRDIIERHNISHPKALTDLVHWLLDNIASLYSINRLTNYLSSLGHKTSKTLVANYLNWFEDAYFLYTVRLYDASLIKSNANAKKIYCVDHAFVSSISTGILVNSGHLLENLVFMALRRTGEKVFYYRTQNKREVDFIVIRKGRKPVLIQVSETLVEERTYMREVRALEEAMKEMTIEKGFIITRNEEEIVNTKSANLYIIPVWKFLLQWPENELFE